MEFTDSLDRHPCVYRIWNEATQLFYIGASSFSAFSCYTVHKRLLEANRHHCVSLQTDWNVSLGAGFQFEVLELTDEATVWEREQFWWDHFIAIGCYNKRPNGEHRGHWKEEDKRRMAEKISKTSKAQIAAGLRKTGWERMVAKYGEEQARQINARGNKAAGGRGNRGKH